MNSPVADTAPGASWLASRAPRPRALAGLLAAAAIAAAVPLALLPTAAADPQHTVVFQITGHGDAFSIIPDPGTPVYPANTNTWVPLPWSSPPVTVNGGQYLALNWTDHSGNHDCKILVDGKSVHLTEHSPGRCAYQMPG
jgi:hypothetical protein